MLELDYHAFDQSLPAGGWRAIVDNVDAGKTLDAYLIHNNDQLETWQQQVVRWHAGQMYALGDLTVVALARFKTTFRADEPSDDTFGWNAYVKGTIGFLEKDRDKLTEAHHELKLKNPTSHNFKILESFLRCFEKTYKETYGQDCR